MEGVAWGVTCVGQPGEAEGTGASVDVLSPRRWSTDVVMRVASGVNIGPWLNNAAFVRKFNREPIAIVLDWQYHKDGPLAKCARRSHTSPAAR